jgi:2-polyprenyl-6-methoxyphenol hydroxylase-like FAD-dependent oxidoreductase
MFPRLDPEVLVVGAGPVGLAAALQLQDRGIRVEVIDRGRRTTQHSYALAIHPRTLRLLDQCGISARVIAQGRKVTRLAFYEGMERRAQIDFSRLAVEHPYLLLLRQSILERALEQELRERKLKVHWAHRLQSLDADAIPPDAEVAQLDEITTGYPVATNEWVVVRTARVRPAYVIGADGYDSFVRRAAGIEMDAMGGAQIFSVFEFQAEGELPDEVRVILGAEQTSVYWPLEPGRCRWGFQITDPSQHVATQEHLEALLRERATWFTARPQVIYWSTLGVFERQLARQFGRGRVWLAGDAAHQASPVGVHSMNQGLAEATDLARQLADTLRVGADPHGLDDRARDAREAWRGLFGAGKDLVAAEPASPWIVANRRRIIECIQASGEDLASLLGQIGLTQGSGGKGQSSEV